MYECAVQGGPRETRERLKETVFITWSYRLVMWVSTLRNTPYAQARAQTYILWHTPHTHTHLKYIQTRAHSIYVAHAHQQNRVAYIFKIQWACNYYAVGNLPRKPYPLHSRVYAHTPTHVWYIVVASRTLGFADTHNFFRLSKPQISNVKNIRAHRASSKSTRLFLTK